MRYIHIFYILKTIFSSKSKKSDDCFPGKNESQLIDNSLDIVHSNCRSIYSHDSSGIDQSCDYQSITDLKKESTDTDRRYNALDDIKLYITSESSSNNDNDCSSESSRSDITIENEPKNKSKSINRYHSCATKEKRNPSRSYQKYRANDDLSKPLIHSHSDNNKRKVSFIIYESSTRKNYKKIKTSDKLEVSKPYGKSLINSRLDISNNLHTFRCNNFTKFSVSNPESVKKSLTNRFCIVENECFSKAIRTNNKSYRMFIDIMEFDICFNDICNFIFSGFLIDVNIVQTKKVFFLNLINLVDRNEKKFWEKPVSADIVSDLKYKILDCISKFNFCNQDSPFIRHCPGLLHMKCFIKNLILSDINLVKHSCLWILLLKFLQSLTIPSTKDLSLAGKCHITNSDSEFKDYDIFEENEDISSKLKEFYETFDLVTRMIFLKAKILKKFIVMLDFMKLHHTLCNRDRQILLGEFIGFSRVITDIILRIRPNAIYVLFLQIKKQKSIILDRYNVVHSISKFSLNLCNCPIDYDSDDIWNFQMIYMRITSAYIDFFRQEAAQFDFSHSKNSLITKEINLMIRDLVESYEIKKFQIVYVSLREKMKFCGALCFVFNYIMKFRLDSQKYSDDYMNKALMNCKNRLLIICNYIESHATFTKRSNGVSNQFLLKKIRNFSNNRISE